MSAPAPAWLRRLAAGYLAFEDRLDERLRALWSRLRQDRPQPESATPNLARVLPGPCPIVPPREAPPSPEPGTRGPAPSMETARPPGRLRRARAAYLAWEERLDRRMREILAPVVALARACDRLWRWPRPRGPLRLLTELAGEATTLGAAGLVVLLALAQPAFRETDGNWLKRLQLAVTFLDRDGREIGRRGIRHDDRAALATLPPHLVEAVVAIEDRRFFRHHGIDPVGLGRALAANARASGIVQGGSTLTQQLAKNLFLTNERSLSRKIKEAFLALWLEAHLTKAEILQLYLDRAYMGAGTFGVGAAAETYFGKPVQQVTLAEAAMLAGLFKAPTRYAPHVSPAAAQARAGEVLAAMLDARFITPAEAAEAQAHPAEAAPQAPERRPDYYLDHAFREVERLASADRLGADTVLIVRTPLDGALQQNAEATLDRLLDREGPRFGVRQAALVVMEPNGALRAMVGGRDYGDSQFNRATEAKRQPGSAFKPFVYAAALAETGLTPDSIVTDTEICISRWCPHNYGRSYAGSVPLWQALARSINTIPVKLSIEIGRAALAEDGHPTPKALRVGNLARRGRDRIVDLAHRMGLRTPLPDSASLPIGAAEVTVLDMTAAYAVFANGGRTAPPSAILDIRNSRGEVLYRRDRDGERPRGVLSDRIVAGMNTMLSKVPEQGTGRRAALPGLHSAGKTGTTNAYRDAWYVGFTGDLVAGIWFGNDDYAPTRGLTGGSLPAQAWHDVIGPAMKEIEPSPIPGLAPQPRMAAGPGFVELVPVAARGGSRGLQPLAAKAGF